MTCDLTLYIKLMDALLVDLAAVAGKTGTSSEAALNARTHIQVRLKVTSQ